jgi:hypothetical protein
MRWAAAASSLADNGSLPRCAPGTPQQSRYETRASCSSISPTHRSVVSLRLDRQSLISQVLFGKAPRLVLTSIVCVRRAHAPPHAPHFRFPGTALARPSRPDLPVAGNRPVAHAHLAADRQTGLSCRHAATWQPIYRCRGSGRSSSLARRGLVISPLHRARSWCLSHRPGSARPTASACSQEGPRSRSTRRSLTRADTGRCGKSIGPGKPVREALP